MKKYVILDLKEGTVVDGPTDYSRAREYAMEQKQCFPEEDIVICEIKERAEVRTSVVMVDV